jgi:hypothetical protein
MLVTTHIPTMIGGSNPRQTEKVGLWRIAEKNQATQNKVKPVVAMSPNMVRNLVSTSTAGCPAIDTIITRFGSQTIATKPNATSSLLARIRPRETGK